MAFHHCAYACVFWGASVCGGIVALVTRKWRHAAMNSFVSFEDRSSRGRKVALVTRKGFVSEWITRCCLRSPAVLKSLLHCCQLKSLSSEWVDMCCFRLPARLKEYWHCSQVKGFSPLWTRKWLFSFSIFMVEKPQVLQVWDFFSSMARNWVLGLFDILAICVNLLGRSSRITESSEKKTWSLCT